MKTNRSLKLTRGGILIGLPLILVPAGMRGGRSGSAESTADMLELLEERERERKSESLVSPLLHSCEQAGALLHSTTSNKHYKTGKRDLSDRYTFPPL